MRVLHVIPALAERYGGPGVVAVASVRALRAQGVDAMIATTDADGEERLQVPHGRVIEWAGVPVMVWPLGGGERFKWSSALARWLAGHVHHYDVVDIHAVFSHSSVAAGRACRRAGVPYVVRPHGALDAWSLSRKRWRKRLLLWCGIRRLLAHAAFLQYTSAGEQSGAEQELPWLPPGRVVALGVDDDAFGEPAADRERPYVLALSRLEEKKSLDLLIDAFHLSARGDLGAWRLVLAGEGQRDYTTTLRRRAAAGAAAGRIDFPGWVTGDLKRSWLRRASVFASPSAQENFGLSVVEAMATGVPVLVTPGVNLSRDILEAGGGWVVERDTRAVASRLRDVMADEALRTSCGRAARVFADQFRWSHTMTALTDLYTDTLSASRGARGV